LKQQGGKPRYRPSGIGRVGTIILQGTYDAGRGEDSIGIEGEGIPFRLQLKGNQSSTTMLDVS